MSVFIIAEIGNNHEGSVGLAKQFIKVASDCGADAVKFQTYIFEAESLSIAPNPPYFNDETRKKYFERTSFNLSQYRILKEYAETECGVEFISSPFSEEAVNLLMKLGVNTIKIPSGEVSNIPLLEYIAKTKKKILLSSGMSSWEELDEAVNIFKGSNELVILQCTSEYPCLPENAGLNLMLEMRERYCCEVGFSDHTIGLAVPLAAVVLGANVIEKHFTLTRLMYGSDAKNSTEPSEFKQLVSEIRAVEKAINNKIDKDAKMKNLGEMKLTFEKSIVAKNDLDPGHIINENDLDYKKPGNGIPAREYKSLIGKILKVSIKANTLLKFSDFE